MTILSIFVLCSLATLSRSSEAGGFLKSPETHQETTAERRALDEVDLYVAAKGANSKGACRVKGGPGKLLFPAFHADSRNACKAACSDLESCKAYEFRKLDGRCEIHTEAIDEVEAHDYADFSCWRRTGKKFNLIGHGACRTTGNKAGNEHVIGTPHEVASEHECKSACRKKQHCVAVEYKSSTGRCELHSNQMPKVEEHDYSEFICEKKIVSQQPSKLEVSDKNPLEKGFSFVGKGACRNINHEDTTSLAVSFKNMATGHGSAMVQCFEQCLKTPNCSAYEFRALDGRCEIKPGGSAALDIVTTDSTDYSRFWCFNKTFSSGPLKFALLANSNYGHGSCRSSSSNPILLQGATAAEDCEKYCLKSTDCMAYQLDPSTLDCFIHRSRILGIAGVNLSEFGCWSKPQKTPSLSLRIPWGKIVGILQIIGVVSLVGCVVFIRKMAHDQNHAAGYSEASQNGPAASSANEAERGSARWGEGLDDPQAGARAFFPPGWKPDPTMTLEKSFDLMGMDGAHKEAIFQEANDKLQCLQRAHINADVRQVQHVLAYTSETPAYRLLNQEMRTPSTDKSLARLSTYIHGLTNAVKILPAFTGTAFRALDHGLCGSSYPEGGLICWQAFASSTKSIDQSMRFLRKNGNQLSGTLVIINSRTGRELELVSRFPHEKEVLFVENTFFKVVKWHKTEADKRAALPSFADYDISGLAVLELEEM